MVTTRELAQERLTVAEAAERLGVSKSTVYRYVREGRLASAPDEQGLRLTGLDVAIMRGELSLGRNGGRLYSDDEIEQFLADDRIDLPEAWERMLDDWNRQLTA